MIEYKTTSPKKRNLSTAEKVSITNSASAEKIFRLHYEGIDSQESFWVLYLNNANNPIAIYKVAMGGVSSVLVDPKLIFKCAIEVLATGIILCHNHPSGNMVASQADKDLTNRIKVVADALNVRLLDHLILSPTDGEIYSFTENCMI